jgi:Concanavalin A-like lectin/glucanases superfamily
MYRIFSLFVFGTLVPISHADEADLRKAVTFYASFDASVNADVGGGELVPKVRAKHATEKEKFVVEEVNSKIVHIAKDRGIAGGCLNVSDLLPQDGRLYYPAKDNIAFKKEGWSGSVSMWCRTNPDTFLKTKFCDPLQITQKGYDNGALWFDFNDKKPRDLRHGVFTARADNQKAVKEEDPKAPLVRVPGIGWKELDWHHVVITFKNLDTGKPDAVTALYIDGKLKGEVKEQAIAMKWEMAEAKIYLALSYIGLIDEFALFDKALTGDEVQLLHKKPALLTPLKKSSKTP